MIQPPQSAASRRAIPIFLGLLFFMPWCEGGALAQSAGSTSAPAQIEQRIDPQRQRQIQPERLRPDVGIEAPPAVPPTEQAFSFVLSAVVIQGATVFKPSDFAPFYGKLLATRVGQGEVKAIAEAITKAYQDAGYIFSQADVPPQDVVGGVLTIQVTEGFVARIDIEGPFRNDAVVSGYLAPVLADRPVRLATIERALLLANDLPGVTLVNSAVADGDGPGAKILKLRFEEQAYSGDLYLDNRGTPSSGRLQAWASGAAHGMALTGSRLQAGLFTIPDAPRELLYGMARWSQPLGSAGTTGEVTLSGSRVDAGDSLAASDTESSSRRVQLVLRHPVLRTRQKSLWLVGELDYYDLSEDRFGADNYEDRNRTLRLGLEFYRPEVMSGDVYAKAMYARGLDVLGASNPGNGLLSRSDGKAEFDMVTLEVRRLQKLWGGLGLYAQAKGQWANQPLLTGSEFSLGGSQYGRAYDYGELVGDRGAAGLVELRYTGKDPASWIGSYDLYMFFDAGVAWNDGGSRQSLTSMGGGLRATLTNQAYADLQVAKPLNRDVATEGDGDVRLLFAVGAGF